MPPTSIRPVAFLLGIFLLAAGVVRADDQSAQSSTDSRLRSALQQAMQQLQDAQDQAAQAQAAQAQSDQDKTALQTKLDAANAQITSITKESADDSAAAKATEADLNSKLSDQTALIGKLNDAITQWQKDDKQYRDLATQKEAARAQLAGQAIMLQRTVDDRETKNLQLFNLGNEILTRYEKYSLGEALVAKEPFTGIARVKLQEAVQDYKDKIADLRVESGSPVTTQSLEPVPANPPATKPSGSATGSAPAAKKTDPHPQPSAQSTAQM